MTAPRTQHAATQSVAAESLEPRFATERARHLPLDIGRVARAARDAADVTQIELAKQSGAPRAWIQKWESGEGAPRVDHLLRSPRAYRRAVVQALASIDGDVVHAVAPDALSHGARAAVLARECTDPVREYLAALADGELSAAERACVCAELRELIAAAGAALVALENE